MVFFTEAEARSAAKRAMKNRSLGEMITESMESSKRATRFDIFLSHSISDAELVLGVKVLLEGMGKKVYVDWVDDPELDRRQVTQHTAERLGADETVRFTSVHRHRECFGLQMDALGAWIF